MHCSKAVTYIFYVLRFQTQNSGLAYVGNTRLGVSESKESEHAEYRSIRHSATKPVPFQSFWCCFYQRVWPYHYHQAVAIIGMGVFSMYLDTTCLY